MAKADKKAPDDAGDDEEEKKEAPASRFPLKKILIIAVAVLALVAAGVGGTMLVTSLFSKSEPVKKVAKKTADETEGEEKDPDAKEGGKESEQDNEKDKAEGEGEEDTNPDGTPRVALYMDIEQPFVVNFQDEGQLRYLQITISVMTKNPKVIEEMKRHMPLIRNNLVMLFSGQTREGIISREGKEKIRKDAEAEVQKILKEQTGNPGVKALYFTSFVMQ
ncbi:MAG TPA: flagellar basal body-associated FliL family protein [Acidiferrobacterales bacterium]|nr:flagellar basal body-associated FliL family protein [Acidiferrobacterales bacterium]